MKSFEGSFRNLNVSPSSSVLLNFFFPFIDIRCFFSLLKLQYCQTIVFLNKLIKLFKETSFSKRRRWSYDFPPRKTQVALKHSTISRQEKMAFSTPRGVALGLPFPLIYPIVCTDVQAYADVRTKISRIDRLPDLSPMVLCKLR